MNVRELLRYELWSKEISQKIIRRIWKILKPVAVVSGILVLLLGVVFAVEWYWLTGGEREAGKAALTKIEALEQLEKNASDGFDAVDSQAKALVTLARQKVWTLRDRRTLEELEFYRWELETEHDRRIRESELRSMVIERYPERHVNPELEQESREADVRTLNWIRSLLHKELD